MSSIPDENSTFIIGESFTTSFSMEGDGWIELPNGLTDGGFDETEIDMKIVTHSSDGILLWHGQGPATAGGMSDFFSIAGKLPLLFFFLFSFALP